MKVRPILFSAPMVRAILAGAKTQTRRVVKSRKDLGFGCTLAAHELAGEVNAGDYSNCPYGQPGDRLWVRETWQHSNSPLGPYDESCTVFYRADYMDDPHGLDGEKSPEGRYRNWVPSIHMFRSASRITLEITAVRVERLQDISDADAQAEGPPKNFKSWRDDFCALWQQINGPGSWEANPWVWVVEFRRADDAA